jgi:hypothetical protein
MPQFNTIDVPFRGREYTCRASHRPIFHAERELGLNILAPNEPHLFKQPTGYMLAALTWMLLRSKLPTLTIDEVFDDVLADMPAYDKIGIVFVEQLKGVLPWADQKGDAKAEAPLAETDSGASDGPQPVSSSDSQPASSGD